MKSKVEKNILVAFILNVSFSIFEFIGGIFTNSISIMSDAIHDFGDALSIGISLFLERKSKKEPDDKYTYGYARYSILGAFITTLILTIGSIFVIYNAVLRIINPTDINYNGMIVFAVVGTIVNFLAAYFTKEGESLNQKAVNLHMLEDVLGWVVVLIGAIIMRFTDIKIIDPLMSIAVAVFLLFHAIKSFKDILDLFLEKVPKNINIEEVKKHILGVKNVIDIHHIHIWSLDENNNFATIHVVADLKNITQIKHDIREELEEHKINHSTIEFEDKDNICNDKECKINKSNNGHNHQHHH